MTDKRKNELHLEYPCQWTYTVIGPDESEMRRAIEEIVAEREHEVELSNTSSQGKYCSISLNITVQDETERVQIYKALRSRSSVKIVL